MFEEGVHLVMDLPVSPQVRAAAYRMLAGLPGVRAAGRTRDPLDRPGQAVAIANPESGGGRGETRLIIDPVGLLPLALEHVITAPDANDPHTARTGELTWYQVVLDAGWTDTAPDLPEQQLGPEDGIA
ncbi:hypothetical protein ACWDSD_34870 [Streptomyces spiralis]